MRDINPFIDGASFTGASSGSPMCAIRTPALVPAIGLLIAGPLYIWAYIQPSWQAAATILLLPGIFAYTCLGPTYGVVQNAVLPNERATATALLFSS